LLLHAVCVLAPALRFNTVPHTNLHWFTVCTHSTILRNYTFCHTTAYTHIRAKTTAATTLLVNSRISAVPAEPQPAIPPPTTVLLPCLWRCHYPWLPARHHARPLLPVHSYSFPTLRCWAHPELTRLTFQPLHAQPTPLLYAMGSVFTHILHSRMLPFLPLAATSSCPCTRTLSLIAVLVRYTVRLPLRCVARVARYWCMPTFPYAFVYVVVHLPQLQFFARTLDAHPLLAPLDYVLRSTTWVGAAAVTAYIASSPPAACAAQVAWVLRVTDFTRYFTFTFLRIWIAPVGLRMHLVLLDSFWILWMVAAPLRTGRWILAFARSVPRLDALCATFGLLYVCCAFLDYARTQLCCYYPVTQHHTLLHTFTWFRPRLFARYTFPPHGPRTLLLLGGSRCALHTHLYTFPGCYHLMICCLLIQYAYPDYLPLALDTLHTTLPRLCTTGLHVAHPLPARSYLCAHTGSVLVGSAPARTWLVLLRTGSSRRWFHTHTLSVHTCCCLDWISCTFFWF